MDQLYAAFPLEAGSKQIRVVTVEAATDDAPLSATLDVIDMAANGPTFSALSYVWSQYSDHGTKIFCDGVAISIPTNCYLALVNLREKLGQYTIWVDTICIKQNDRNEKAFQIPLMHEIYTKASDVYVWLGPGSPVSDRAMAYLSRGGLRDFMDGQSRSQWKAVGYLIHPKSTAYPAHDHQFALALGKSSIAWADIQQTLSVLWAGRVWTYQEILFASNPVVVCGQQHVPWDVMTDALLLLKPRIPQHGQMLSRWVGMAFTREQLQSEPGRLQERRDFAIRARSYWLRLLVLRLILCIILVTGLGLGGYMTAFQTSKTNHGVRVGLHVLSIVIFAILGLCLIAYVASRVVHIRENQQGFPMPEAPANDFLQGLYERQATEKRDMAYGAWNIMRALGATSLPEVLYNISEDRVYRQLAVSVIRMNKDLQVLYLAAMASVTPEGPSWVPDWSARGLHNWRTDKHNDGVTPEGVVIDDQSEAIRRLQEERLSHVVRLKDEALIVSARDLAYVTQCPDLLTTSSDLKSEELDRHLDNLQTMFLWVKWQQSVYRNFRDEDGFDNAMRFATYHQRQWARRLEPSWGRKWQLYEYLIRHCFGEPTPEWFAPWLQLHIETCNKMADFGQKYCIVRMRHRPRKDYVAICSSNTQPGERILRIQGLLQPLVVKDIGNDSVRLSSPLKLLTPRYPDLWSWTSFPRPTLQPFREIEIR